MLSHLRCSSSPSRVALGVVGLLLTHCGNTGSPGAARAPAAAPAASSAGRCPARVSALPPVLECSATGGGGEPLVDDFDDENLSDVVWEFFRSSL